jgi:membrane-associated phospholipid phosphatase
MENLYQLEIVWILIVQALGDWLAGPFKMVTMLGNEEFYLLLMPILYWAVHPVFGFRMAIMLLLSNGVNSVLKLVFHSPRPYWLDGQVRAMIGETSFGAPSGHAQNAASLWGLMAVFLGGTWTRVGLVVVIFLIGFSRVYLGVHFISDIVLGWIAGGLLLLAYLKVEQRITPWLSAQPLKQMVLLAIGSSAVLALMILLAAASLGSWTVPLAWEENALTAFPDEAIHPLTLSGAFTVSGTWLGLMVGVAWLYHRKGWFNTSGPAVQRVLRCLVGLVGVVILWYGLGAIFPRGEEVLSYALRYLRYALIGLWVSALAPLLFERLRLCGQWNTSSVGDVKLRKGYL